MQVFLFLWSKRASTALIGCGTLERGVMQNNAGVVSAVVRSLLPVMLADGSDMRYSE